MYLKSMTLLMMCGHAEKTYQSPVESKFPSVIISWYIYKLFETLGQCSAAAVGDFIYVFIHGYYIVRYCPTTDSYSQMGDSLPLPRWVI